MNGTIKVVDGDYKGLEAFDNVHMKNFLKAVLEVDNSYYYYSNNHQNGPSHMQEQLERVFAYELYHQWSILIGDYNKNKNCDDKRIINGEVGKKLEGCAIFPDMILHKGQEDISNQEIAVEIKRKISLSEDNLINDLEKLSDMLTKGKLGCGATPFKYSVFLLTGGGENDLIKMLNKDKLTDINDSIICVFCKHKGELQYKSMDDIKK